jgi:hypothetical protein
MSESCPLNPIPFCEAGLPLLHPGGVSCAGDFGFFGESRSLILDSVTRR